MSDGQHKFWCTSCKFFIYGESEEKLSRNVNSHSFSVHPHDALRYSPESVVCSSYYYAPGAPVGERVNQAIEKYLVPHGTAQTSHIDRYITDDDKLLLKKALIRW